MTSLKINRIVFFVIVTFIFNKYQPLNAFTVPSNKNDTDGALRSEEFQARTDVAIHNFTYTWTIRPFSYYENKSICLESPIFSAATNDECLWRIKFCPCDVSNDNHIKTVGIHCFLRTESKMDQVTGKSSLSILSSNGTVVWSRKEHHEFQRGSRGRGWLINKDYFFRNQLLQNDALILSFKLSYYIPFSNTTRVYHYHQRFQSNTTTTPEFNTSGSDLVENLGSLFENPSFADVLISVNGKNFWAHKNILATRSAIFGALIRNTITTDEVGRTLLSITDMDEEVTGEILRYIYTGKCKNLSKLAKGLLVAADKYALPLLKKICAKMVGKSLSVENAADLLVFADTHGPDELKAQVIEFIVANSTQVLNSMAWKRMVPSNSKLVNEVCQALALFSSGNSKDKNNITQMCHI